MRTRLDQKGFTLLELVTAAVILVMLAGLAVPKVTRAKHYAYMDQVINSLRNLAERQETHYLRYGTYTDSATSSNLAFTPDKRVLVDITVLDQESWVATAEHLTMEGVTCAIAYGRNVPNGYIGGKAECSTPPALN